MPLNLVRINLEDDHPQARSATAPFVGRDHLGQTIAQFSVVTRDEADTMGYALSAYAHLLNRNEQVSLRDYADRIAATYALSTPRNAEVVHTLRRCATYPVIVNFGLYTVDFDCEQTGSSVSVFRVPAATAQSAEDKARGSLNPRYTWTCTAVDRTRNAA